MNQMTQLHDFKSLVLGHFNLDLSDQLHEGAICHGASDLQVVVFHDRNQLVFVVPGPQERDPAGLIGLSVYLRIIISVTSYFTKGPVN